jgi:hypothetical protein
VRAVRSGNIITDKNLHNKIIDKNLSSQLFIKTSISTFVLTPICQYIRRQNLEHFIFLLLVSAEGQHLIIA